MMQDEQKPDPPPEEFQKFEELTREILKVSKAELRVDQKEIGPESEPS